MSMTSSDPARTGVFLRRPPQEAVLYSTLSLGACLLSSAWIVVCHLCMQQRWPRCCYAASRHHSGPVQLVSSPCFRYYSRVVSLVLPEAYKHPVPTYLGSRAHCMNKRGFVTWIQGLISCLAHLWEWQNTRLTSSADANAAIMQALKHHVIGCTWGRGWAATCLILKLGSEGRECLWINFIPLTILSQCGLKIQT